MKYKRLCTFVLVNSANLEELLQLKTQYDMAPNNLLLLYQTHFLRLGFQKNNV